MLAARRGAAASKRLSETAKAGVKVLADGVDKATLDTLADLVVDGCDQVIWY